MEGRPVLSYIETCSNTTPILSTTQARWLRVGHVMRFLQFLAALGLIALYIVGWPQPAFLDAASPHTRGRNIGASPLRARLPEREVTLLSVTVWRSGVVKSGDDILTQLSRDRTLATFLGEGDHDHKMNLYRTTKTVGTGPNIMRILGLRTSGGHSRNKTADSGKMMHLQGWTADEHPMQADARSKAINNFKETYRIISRDIYSDDNEGRHHTKGNSSGS